MLAEPKNGNPWAVPTSQAFCSRDQCPYSSATLTLARLSIAPAFPVEATDTKERIRKRYP
uniref:Uncharacterized protein n=1 Tax=Candidatus Kentrum sp. LFY TaxID=2126342 RepID=A0A450UMS4_9GAMM|nr:MAG: hypothetical protein BECKLFY1418A_GA0070994_103425 [Candidatus Kentron sp. LFY]VFJ98000.1 MAG: hypothetical protein BECKLFY1418B_GA0070995_11121 [Candidatus Kentron sp. LFY]VFK16938.1 MAG: hypothetical protein BECKLFY1418C_GA0070996_102723 [Candidatus Kentron sp. LFY]